MWYRVRNRSVLTYDIPDAVDSKWNIDHFCLLQYPLQYSFYFNLSLSLSLSLSRARALALSRSLVLEFYVLQYISRSDQACSADPQLSTNSATSLLGEMHITYTYMHIHTYIHSPRFDFQTHVL